MIPQRPWPADLEVDWHRACAVWQQNPIVQSNQVGPNYDRVEEHRLCLELAKNYPAEIAFFLEKLAEENPIFAAYAMKVVLRIRTPETVIPEDLFERPERIRTEWRGALEEQSLGDYFEEYREFDPEVQSVDVWDERWQQLRDGNSAEAIFMRGQIAISKRPRRGIALMRKALKRGYLRAACLLCDTYSFEDTYPEIPVDPGKARIYHKVLAENGDLESAAVLRQWLHEKTEGRRVVGPTTLRSLEKYTTILADATDYPESVKATVKWCAIVKAYQLETKDPKTSAAYRAKAEAIIFDDEEEE